MKETKKVKWLKEMNHIGEGSLLRNKLSAVRSLRTTLRIQFFIQTALTNDLFFVALRKELFNKVTG